MTKEIFNEIVSNLFVKVYKRRPLIIENGSGSYLFTKNGNKYLDFISGISVNNLGYFNPNIQESITRQLAKIIHPSNYFYTQVQIDLARKLLKISGLDKVFFANSGTEANEAALSFILEYSKATPEKNEILVFQNSFFGRTYGSYNLANNGNYRNLKFKLIPFNDNETLKKNISESTLGIVLELVLGHGGIKKIQSDVLETIRQIHEERSLILMIDEVQTGLGRTGSAFLFQESNIKPDIVTLGKSLGGGLPLSAVLASDRIAQVIQPGSYGCTMGGNSLACAAGIIIVDYLLKDSNLKKIQKKGIYLLDKLQALSKDYSKIIIEARCYGLMGALELRDESAAEGLALSCMKEGLLIDIVNKNVIRLLPPFNVSYNEINFAIKIIKNTLKKNYVC